MSSFDLDQVDRFIAGAVGMPGERTFFFQALAGKTLVSFKAEKGHIAALVEHLGRMLSDLPPVTEPVAPWATLDLPVFAEWDVGTIGLGYERENDTIIVVLSELDRSSFGADPSESSGVEQAKFRLTRAQAEAFVLHGEQLVKAGRPTCSFCATPIDPDGYNCACYN